MSYNCPENLPSSPQVKQGNSALSFFFLNVVVDLAFKDLFFPLFLPSEFLWMKSALRCPLFSFSILSLARDFSLKSRDAIRFSTNIFCLMFGACGEAPPYRSERS